MLHWATTNDWINDKKSWFAVPTLVAAHCDGIILWLQFNISPRRKNDTFWNNCILIIIHIRIPLATDWTVHAVTSAFIAKMFYLINLFNDKLNSLHWFHYFFLTVYSRVKNRRFWVQKMNLRVFCFVILILWNYEIAVKLKFDLEFVLCSLFKIDVEKASIRWHWTQVDQLQSNSSTDGKSLWKFWIQLWPQFYGLFHQNLFILFLFFTKLNFSMVSTIVSRCLHSLFLPLRPKWQRCQWSLQGKNRTSIEIRD